MLIIFLKNGRFNSRVPKHEKGYFYGSFSFLHIFMKFKIEIFIKPQKFDSISKSFRKKLFNGIENIFCLNPNNYFYSIDLIDI